jgi:hypothetical protein
MGFVVDKAALWQVSSHNSDSLATHSIDCCALIIIHHPGLVQDTNVPIALNLTPTPKKLVNSLPVLFISKVTVVEMLLTSRKTKYICCHCLGSSSSIFKELHK